MAVDRVDKFVHSVLIVEDNLINQASYIPS
jgi:hypothetical protein